MARLYGVFTACLLSGLSYAALAQTPVTTDTATASEQVMVVLDASGSMWGQVDGRTKIEIVREAYGGLLDRWTGQPVDAGLIVYGHRRKGDCGDIELVSHPGPVDAKAQKTFTDKLNPKGKTPLGASVRQAAEVLKYTEEKATVVLLTDGIETCDVDPCALGRELEASGIDFTAHVIGFDIKSDEDKAQLACLATETGGTYISASNADELDLALRDATGTDSAAEPGTYKAFADGVRLQAVLDTTQTSPSGQVTWTLKSGDTDITEITETSYIDLTSLETLSDATGRLSVRAVAKDGIYSGEADFALPFETSQTLVLTSTAPETNFEFEAPVMSSTRFDVIWTGQGTPDDMIAIVPVGGSYSDAVMRGYVSDGSTFSMRAPHKAGQYEMIYVYDAYGVAREDARVPLAVEASEVSLTPLGPIRAGQSFQVRWEGPALEEHTVAIGPLNDPGNETFSMAWFSSGNPATLTAPDAPGEYELRYYAEDYNKVLTRPVTVE